MLKISSIMVVMLLLNAQPQPRRASHTSRCAETVLPAVSCRV